MRREFQFCVTEKRDKTKEGNRGVKMWIFLLLEHWSRDLSEDGWVCPPAACPQCELSLSFPPLSSTFPVQIGHFSGQTASNRVHGLCLIQHAIDLDRNIQAVVQPILFLDAEYNQPAVLQKQSNTVVFPNSVFCDVLITSDLLVSGSQLQSPEEKGL